MALWGTNVLQATWIRSNFMVEIINPGLSFGRLEFTAGNYFFRFM